MTSLRSVLLKNVEPIGLPEDALGGDDEQRAPIQAEFVLDRDRLRRDLSAVSQANNRYFLVCVVMVLVLFVASLGVILANLGKPDIIKIVMGAFGISSAGLITIMIKLWREKSNIELLMVLATNMDAETLKTVVAVLVRRL